MGGKSVTTSLRLPSLQMEPHRGPWEAEIPNTDRDDMSPKYAGLQISATNLTAYLPLKSLNLREWTNQGA